MSAGGALIESDQPLRPGAEARLELASKLSSNALCQESRAITGLEKHAYKGSIPSRLTITQSRLFKRLRPLTGPIANRNRIEVTHGPRSR
jgi:hypothetical protein